MTNYDHFWPLFCQLYIHLSQNLGSDSHFEVLNRSEPQLVQKLWHIMQIGRLNTNKRENKQLLSEGSLLEPAHFKRWPVATNTFTYRAPLGACPTLRTSWMSFLATGASCTNIALGRCRYVLQKKVFKTSANPLKWLTMKAEDKNNSFLIAPGPSKIQPTKVNEAVGAN